MNWGGLKPNEPGDKVCLSQQSWGQAQKKLSKELKLVNKK
jgi:hypothetical protein